MGSTLVNNTFIFSLFHVKLREIPTNVSISFFETLTSIVREAVTSASKNLVDQNAFAIDPNAKS